MTAAVIRRLLAEAEAQEAAQTMATVARLVGIGEGTLTSRDRSADTVRRRAVAAWILCDRLEWSQAKAAKHLKRTERQLRSLLKTLS